jgi:DNA-binding GntR family transcriptional regulator
MAPLEAIIDRMADVGNAAETAYAAILTNTLKPGTRLRADDLAGMLGVSKTPVREALRKLQAEALITVQAGNALTVKEVTEQELLEIYYTREALEGMAARLAADNAGTLDPAPSSARSRLAGAISSACGCSPATSRSWYSAPHAMTRSIACCGISRIRFGSSAGPR